MKTTQVIGRGARKVLLFPGLLGTREAFDEMLRYADLDNFQYAIAEYHGYGEARGQIGLLTLREVVIDAVRLVEFLGWSGFTVGGHSLGALIAQMVAVALPGRVESIVSIAGLNAHGLSDHPERVAFMCEAAVSRDTREALVRAGTAGRYTDAVVRSIVDASWSRIDAAAMASYAEDAGRTDIHAQVASLEMPILVLVGEHDPNNTEALARDTTLRWYGDATLGVLAGAAHYPLFEAPVATVTALERFVQAVTASVNRESAKAPTPA